MEFIENPGVSNYVKPTGHMRLPLNTVVLPKKAVRLDTIVIFWRFAGLFH